MPSPFVAPGYLIPVTSLTIRSSAPAIARPDGSCTRPLIVALGDCPAAALMRNTIKNNRGRGKRNLIRAAPVYGSPLVFVSINFFGLKVLGSVVGFPNT